MSNGSLKNTKYKISSLYRESNLKKYKNNLNPVLSRYSEYQSKIK